MTDDSDELQVVAHQVGTGPRSALLMYRENNVHTWIVSTVWVHLDNVR